MSPRTLFPLNRLTALFAIFSVIAVIGVTRAAKGAPTFSTVTSFTNGSQPDGLLTQAPNGLFYGTTQLGGTANLGTIFSVSPSGNVTILHNFGDGSVTGDGAQPVEGVLISTDGNLYGITSAGGSTGDGTVYRINPTTNVVTILHSFGDGTVANDGLDPTWIQEGPDGNYYGETTNGGSAGDGTIFRITPLGVVWIMHSFGDGTTVNDGSVPKSSMIFARDNNFYGETTAGGSAGEGTLFQCTPFGIVTILHSFGDGSVNNDGETPDSPLTEDANGDILGTTVYGGSADVGTVWERLPTGEFVILHSFGDGSVKYDGYESQSQLLLGSDGDYYSTTNYGGTGDQGTIFKMTPSGQVTLLYSFDDSKAALAGDNVVPRRGMVIGQDGNFYGLTAYGGTKNLGTMYELYPNYQAPVPVISPNGGGYSAAQSVSISDTNANATIYYTTDGTAPTTSSTQYTGPFTVSSWETVNAIASVPGLFPSDAATANFQINLPIPTPTFSPTGGIFSGPQTVSISDTQPGVSIMYSVTDSTGTSALQAYNGPITVSTTETLTAIAQTTHGDSSSEATAQFDITPAASASYSAGLQLISAPCSFGSESLSNIFGYAGADTAVWNPQSDVYAVTPTAPANSIVAGQGYWIRFPAPESVLFSGTPTPTNKPFVIHLVPGWNMIGDPFTIGIPIVNLLFDNETVTYVGATQTVDPLINQNIYSYSNNSNSYSTANDLTPGVGYWILSYGYTDLDILPDGS